MDNQWDDEDDDTWDEPTAATLIGTFMNSTPFSSTVTLWRCSRCNGTFEHFRHSVIVGLYIRESISESSPEEIKRMERINTHNSELRELQRTSSACECPDHRLSEFPRLRPNRNEDEVED